MVEYRFVLGVELDYVLALGGYEVDIVGYLLECFTVVDVDVFKVGAEYVAQYAHYAAFFFENERGGGGCTCFGYGIFPVFDECFHLVV